ncbi:MAG: hypothetical protein ACK5IP_20020 [Paracoccus sp. (in: a-proteobacteria)]
METESSRRIKDKYSISRKENPSAPLQPGAEFRPNIAAAARQPIFYLARCRWTTGGAGTGRDQRIDLATGGVWEATLLN